MLYKNLVKKPKAGHAVADRPAPIKNRGAFKKEARPRPLSSRCLTASPCHERLPATSTRTPSHAGASPDTDVQPHANPDALTGPDAGIVSTAAWLGTHTAAHRGVEGRA